MYPDVDDSKHSKVSINTFLFFLEIPFSGLCLRIGQGKWERPWRFLNLITFCGFLKANNNKKILNSTTHTPKKGASTTRMSTAEQGCVSSMVISRLFTVISAKHRNSLGCSSSLAWCQSSAPAGRGNWVQGRCCSSLEASPHSRQFRA